jgi:ABC-type uncharacterized transport system YnjBCD permease subunit
VAESLLEVAFLYMSGHRSRLKLFPVLALAIFLVPVVAGLLFTWAPAFGHLAAAGSTGFSLEPIAALLRHPSLPGALRSTLVSGLGATLFRWAWLFGSQPPYMGRDYGRLSR